MMFADSISELTDRFAGGKTTVHFIVESAVSAAEKLNESLNAFLEIDRKGALARAAEIDGQMTKGDVPKPGPLAGIPIAIKDNLCTTFGTTTCSESPKLRRNVSALRASWL